MLSKNINFRNFKIIANKKKIRKVIKNLFSNNNELFKSFSNKYKDSYNFKKLKKINKNSEIRLIGIGGSILGAKAIYDFLDKKIKRKFLFVDNFSWVEKNDNKKKINIITSKSGNTIETIINSNLLIKKQDRNIFITEKKNSYLRELAQKLKAEIIDHNNFIGGRYSVLSEVGMLPAELMGLNVKKFRQLNSLIKNQSFLESLIANVSCLISLKEKNINNSVIINYDPKSENLFRWYQQLVAESLGKKNKGFMPIISNMPQDNHSLMQLYLDGFKKNFYTIFFSHEKNINQINKKLLLKSHIYLNERNINNILYNQKTATENIFIKKNIPFRSFEINKKDEKTLGELFIFFILETILIGKFLNINPYDQPSVELIKTESKRLFNQK